MLVVNCLPLREHADDVAALWHRNLAGMAKLDVFAKLRLGYLENPAGDGTCLGLTEESGDPLVGTIFLHPRRMFRGERSIASANMADFAVDAAFRTLGPALQLMKGAVSVATRQGLFLYGFPNKNSAAVCRRAGLHVIGSGLQRYARILTGDHPIVRLWLPGFQFFVRPTVSTAMRVAEVWRNLAFPRPLRCEAARFDDATVDRIWSKRPAGLLLGDRSAAMLNWRYGLEGRGDWNVCIAKDRLNEAVGMLVWRHRNGMAEIGDFFSIAPAELTAPMLNAFCGFARQKGAHSVSLEFCGGQDVRDQIAVAGLRPRGEPSVVVVDRDAADAAGLHDAESWYLTTFDNDAN